MASRDSKPEPFRIALDDRSGVPVYRQIIDRVTGGIARGAIRGGDQLPTVRQLAVDLSINPNTVIRAYRELEIRGIIDTQQGTGTFISEDTPTQDKAERQRMLAQLAGECAARAGAAGFTLEELIQQLICLDKPEKRKR
ncbi:MAG TPA: GntR family transcriptional regulator [Bryobacteraceae bacterium]|jgi:GntR family transcriptional regulator|nr:GntR family transcriptional regulator [Bryobacteraceae bacterium]